MTKMTLEEATTILLQDLSRENSLGTLGFKNHKDTLDKARKTVLDYSRHLTTDYDSRCERDKEIAAQLNHWKSEPVVSDDTIEAAAKMEKYFGYRRKQENTAGGRLGPGAGYPAGTPADAKIGPYTKGDTQTECGCCMCTEMKAAGFRRISPGVYVCGV